MPDTDVELTELYDMDVNEGVHAVHSPANGRTFFFIKEIGDGDAGANDDDPDDDDDDFDFSKAQNEYDALIKAKYSQDDIDKLGAKGQAFKNPDGHFSYPIADKEDLSNAIRAVGRGGASHDTIRKYIVRRAKALGASDAIPDTWGADGSVKKAKADSDDDSESSPTPSPSSDPVAKDGYISMDAPTPSSQPSTGGSGGAAGSPEWEATDSAMADQIARCLADALCAIGCAADREIQEIQAGCDDFDSLYRLEDAMYSLGSALDKIAGFVYREGATGLAKGLDSDKIRESAQQMADVANRLIGQLGADSADQLMKGASEVTDEEIAKLVEGIGGAVAKAVDTAFERQSEADKKARKEAKELAKAAGGGEGAPATLPTADDPAGAPPATTPAGLPPEIEAVLSKATEDADLRSRLEAFLSLPKPGGPASTAGGATGARHEGAAEAFNGAPLQAMQKAIQTEEAKMASFEEGTVQHMLAKTKAEDLRKQLGRDLLRAAFAARGYDDSPTRSMKFHTTPAVATAGASFGN